MSHLIRERQQIEESRKGSTKPLEKTSFAHVYTRVCSVYTKARRQVENKRTHKQAKKKMGLFETVNCKTEGTKPATLIKQTRVS